MTCRTGVCPNEFDIIPVLLILTSRLDTPSRDNFSNKIINERPSGSRKMSLTVTTGYRSLVTLGIGAGDIAALVSVGNRLGNWMSASKGDEGFLALLEQDEIDIIRRRGVLDVARFNKRWSRNMRLLANGRPEQFIGDQIERALGQISRFTASMVSVVAVLDAFASTQMVKTVTWRLLSALILGQESREDLIMSQIIPRINSWRSAGCVRGISAKARNMRNRLQDEGRLLPGYIANQEIKYMVDFLDWFFSGESETFQTTSSDVCGVALCLIEIGYDILSTEGFGQAPANTPCTLVYVSDSFRPDEPILHGPTPSRDLIVREESSTVPLAHPEESISCFPLTQDCANRCRQAWKAGQNASRYVKLQVRRPTRAPSRAEPAGFQDMDMYYDVVNQGRKANRRWDTGIHNIANAQGLVLNQELYENLEGILSREPADTLEWLYSCTDESSIRIFPWNENPARDDVFFAFQAFFMGYYYGVFLEVVDSSSLIDQRVEGAWGYRGHKLLETIRTKCTRWSKEGISRQDLFMVLSLLCLSYEVDIPSVGRGRWCVGVIQKRALLASSLLTACDTPSAVEKFHILDVDVGGIPRDVHGLVRPGLGIDLEPHYVRVPGEALEPRGPPKDFTKHVEPDWEGDPDTVLLCMRYKGRRVCTINLLDGDWAVCSAYVSPVEEPSLPLRKLESAIKCDLDDLLLGRLMLAANQPDKPPMVVIVQTRNKPNMRFALAALYRDWEPVLSSNCIETAANKARIARANAESAAIAEDSEIVKYRDIYCSGLQKAYGLIIIA